MRYNKKFENYDPELLLLEYFCIYKHFEEEKNYCSLVLNMVAMFIIIIVWYIIKFKILLISFWKIFFILL